MAVAILNASDWPMALHVMQQRLNLWKVLEDHLTCVS